MTAHARFSASGAHRWMLCPASLSLEEGCPNTSSAFADEGTAAHELAQMCLTERLDADAFIGRVIPVGERSFTVDDDMAGYVQQYVDAVRELADGHELLVEQRVDYSEAIGVGAGLGFGTADAVIITTCGELQVHDLKYGRGVKVDAEENHQLLLYALGASCQFEVAYDFDRVRLFIHQPRLGHVSEWGCTIGEVDAFAMHAKAAARSAAAKGAPASAGEKQCRFCKAKAVCPVLADTVKQSVVGDFDDLTASDVEDATDLLGMASPKVLGGYMDVVDLVEGWCKAVRARVEGELQQGKPVPGYKLVEGRRGARRWADAGEAEAVLKSMRLPVETMYDLKLISPTSADKLAKAGSIGPRQWSRVTPLITQSPGAPSVTPDSDPRPALNVADDFETLA